MFPYALCGLILLVPGWAMAQVPSAADPARILAPGIEPEAELDQLKSPAQSAEPKALTIPPGADELHFKLTVMTIEGMSAYRTQEIEPIYRELLGKEISLADLYRMAETLQTKYRQEGYVLTHVAPALQDRARGTASLIVTEGYVAEVELQSGLETNPATEDAKACILAMRPLNMLQLERLMLILNELGDLNVSAVVAAMKDPETAPRGAVRLILQKNDVTRKDSSISIDDYGSVFAGPVQGALNLRFYNVGLDNSALGLLVSGTSPLSEQHYGAINYSLPLNGASGLSLEAMALAAESNLGGPLKPLDIEGESQTYRLGLSYPIIKQRAESWKIDGAFEVKNATTDLSGIPLYDDHLRIASVGSNYSFSDEWAGSNVMDVHYSQGLGIFDASEKGDDLSRLDGDPEFHKFEFYAARLQSLPQQFELYALVNGQYSFEPLLSAEEFGFGGSQIGRGYDPSEMTGDRGISGSLELRYRAETEWMDWALVLLPYGFYDIGKVWNIDTGAHNQSAGSSAGFGSRWSLDNTLTGNVNIAWPLTKPADNPPNYTSPHGPRLLFSVNRTF